MSNNQKIDNQESTNKKIDDLSSQVGQVDQMLNALQGLSTQLYTVETRVTRDRFRNGKREDLEEDTVSVRYDWRCQHHDMEDYITRKVKIEGPTFDGTYDPQVFSDWLTDMTTILIDMV